MSVPSILLPVFIQVGLMFVLMFWMGRQRLAAVGQGGVTTSDIALGQRVWPAPAQQAANAYQNQFELPVLFFALAPLAMFTHKADLLFVLLSWLFVLLRIAHAFVHVGSNDVPTRFRLFAAGALVLLAMWAIFAIQIFTGL